MWPHKSHKIKTVTELTGKKLLKFSERHAIAFYSINIIVIKQTMLLTMQEKLLFTQIPVIPSWEL